MRINKYLSANGFCSRRAADDLIKQNKVKINDKVASLGDEVIDGDFVYVNGTKITNKVDESKVILLYNKPPGLICSASSKDGETVFDRIDYPKRLFYAGRLDKASRGLLLLTNDGKLANDLMKAKNAHEREYIVRVNKEISEEAIKKLRKGVYLTELEVKTRPCKIDRISDKEFSITLTQGLNRQIRRMCEAVDLKVLDLFRVRIENLTIGKLKEGTYRKVTAKEKEELLCLFK